MRAPNLLFFLVDQFRADAPGFAGGVARTPHLDAIAAGGTVFSNAVTSAPICVPARASLATGLYPHNTGVWENVEHDLPEETPTWMQAIRAAGYRTSLFGKTHLHRHRGDLREREHLLRAYGWDDGDEIAGPRASAWCLSHMTAEWDRLGLWENYRADYAERFSTKPWVARPSVLPLEEYADVYVGRKAADYLIAYDRTEPWFCTVSFGGPHAPWDAPSPYAEMYRPEDMPEAVPLPSWQRAMDDSTSLGRYTAKAPSLTRKEIAALRANYAGNVTLIDEQIGRVLEVVRARGELENTVIVFSSDHGEMNGDHGLIYKGQFLDAAVRVPLVVNLPGVRPGVNDSPVEWLDLGPTLADCAGAWLEHRQFGRSLVGAVRGESGEDREFALSEISGESMLLDRQWKLALEARGECYLLFDREADPDEQVNLAFDPAFRAVREQLSARLRDRISSTQLEP